MTLTDLPERSLAEARVDADIPNSDGRLGHGEDGPGLGAVLDMQHGVGVTPQ